MNAVDVVAGGNAAERRRVLLLCCGSERWAVAMAGAAPWPDGEALLRDGDRALDELSPHDWLEALAAEDSAAALDGDAAAALDGDAAAALDAHALSAAPASSAADAGTRAALDTALRLYRQRFGFPFVTALPRMQPDEMLMRARIRLGNDEEPEFAVAVGELRRLVRRRLRGQVEQSGAGRA